MRYLLIFIVTLSACTHNFKAKVVYVFDGDTIEVIDANNQDVIIRLADIDCPEKSQPYGLIAKEFTKIKCLDKDVIIKSQVKKDRYGRTIATVYCDNININQELLRNGLAWYYTQYAHNYYYKKLSITAQKEHIGLWSDSKPVMPSIWRKHKKIIYSP